MKIKKEDLEAIINIIKTKDCTRKNKNRTIFDFDFYIGKIFRKKKIEFEVFTYISTVGEKYNSITIESKPYWRNPNIEFKIQIKDKSTIKKINKSLEEKGLLKGRKVEYTSFTEYMEKLNNELLTKKRN